jgi:transposase InsO family protein
MMRATLSPCSITRATSAPRHLISDQGPQFREEYAAWCRLRGVESRFGSVGQHDSIAVIERFFRSLKQEMLGRLAKETLDQSPLRGTPERSFRTYCCC